MQTKQHGLMEYRLNFIKLSANDVDIYLTSIINQDISWSHFSDEGNNALVKHIYKNKERQDKENYRPKCIIDGFLKVYERLIIDSMLPTIQTFLSNFVSAYSANQVLINLIENWRKNLDKIAGAVKIVKCCQNSRCCFLRFIRNFDCISPDLLIVQMEAYGFSEGFLTFLYSYEKREKIRKH